jgi:hypothetical protein
VGAANPGLAPWATLFRRFAACLRLRPMAALWENRRRRLGLLKREESLPSFLLTNFLNCYISLGTKGNAQTNVTAIVVEAGLSRHGEWRHKAAATAQVT